MIKPHTPTLDMMDELTKALDKLDRIKDYIEKHKWTDYDEVYGITVSYNIKGEDILEIIND